MKTIILRNAASTIVVELKVDIFASTTEMTDPSFETNFTAMEIKDEDSAIAMGINVNEINYNFKSIVDLVNGIAGVGLYVIDFQDVGSGEVTIIEA